MENSLYLECYSGISGDMFVAALLDLGADSEKLEKSLESLNIDGFRIEIKRVVKNGIDSCDFDVILDSWCSNNDYDMEYLYGNRHDVHGSVNAHGINHHEREDIQNHVHSHEQISHGSNTDKYHHSHRSLKEILDIIQRSGITDRAKKTAADIFMIIGKAESKAHGVDINDVHFHEVGAVDSIVDIVSAAVCLDDLGIDKVIIPALYEGTGFVRCQHGMLPIPVPAVANIAADNNLNIRITDSEGEYVTPTGAAIAAAIKTSDKLPSRFSIKKIGIGAGKRSYEKASVLRAMIIEDNSEDNDLIYKLESNIDDCTGESLGFVMERLFEAGARDVHYMPVYMKKNRPAYQLNVICKKDDIEKLEQIIFEETTTIGIRRQAMERTVLNREIVTINTSLGEAKVKVCSLLYGRRIYPEYESVTELCRKHNMSYQEVYKIISKECEI